MTRMVGLLIEAPITDERPGLKERIRLRTTRRSYSFVLLGGFGI